mmetsp:Transcript_23692/g.33172  ORF Transcript_23692/g.33172 Transcript_23692/m.33172 type:complete len:164 (+) Transcript_23692:707-1198(+)
MRYATLGLFPIQAFLFLHLEKKKKEEKKMNRGKASKRQMQSVDKPIVGAGVVLVEVIKEKVCFSVNFWGEELLACCCCLFLVIHAQYTLKPYLSTTKCSYELNMDQFRAFEKSLRVARAGGGMYLQGDESMIASMVGRLTGTGPEVPRHASRLRGFSKFRFMQ